MPTPPLAALTSATISEPLDLYTLDISVLLPAGSTDQAIYRFCNWTQTGGASVVYRGLTYTPIPLEASGFESGGSAQLARPALTIANVGLAITSLINKCKTPVDEGGYGCGDLVGATVERIRTLSCYLDGAANADPDAFFGPDVWVIEQRTREDKLVTQWSLAVPFDLEGLTLPSRRLLREQCQWIYLGGDEVPKVGCTYIQPSSLDSGTFTLPAVGGTYRSNINTITCTAPNSYRLGDTVTLTVSSGGAPSGTYTITKEGGAGFEARYSTQYGRSGTWDHVTSGFTTRYRLYVTNHGLQVGQTVSYVLESVPLAFFGNTRSTLVKSGSATIHSVPNANTIVLAVSPAPKTATSGTCTVDIALSGNFTGSNATVLVSKSNHGLVVGQQISVRFPGQPAVSPAVTKIIAADTNTFTIRTPTGLTTQTSAVEWSQWFTATDDPTFTKAADDCSKSLTGCKLRFGHQKKLPFGGFPGLVDRQG